MRKALKLSIDGTLTELDLDAPEGSLAVLQSGVGQGMIEAVDLEEDLTMWVNEEGKLGGFEPNHCASMIFLATFSIVDIIMGDVVFTGGVDDEGDTMGLNPEREASIRSFVAAYVADLSG